MPIQRIEGAPVQRAPYPGAYVSPEAASAPARALGSVARGLSDIANVSEQVVQRQQRLKNRADQLRVEQALKAEEEDFQTFLETEPDETKWLDASTGRVEEVSRQIAEMNLSPIVREEANLRIREWAENRRVQVVNQAERYATRRHDKVLVAQMEAAAEQGDKATIDSIMDERVILGTVDQETAAQSRAQLHQKADMADLDTLLATDPQRAVEELQDPKNYPSLTPDVRLRMQKTARQEVKALHARTYQEFQARINTGDLPTPEQLQEAVEAGDLLSTQVPSLKRQIRGGNDPIQEAIFLDLRRRAVAYKTSDDDEIETMRTDIEYESARLPEYLRSRVMDALNRSTRAGEDNALRRVIFQEIETVHPIRRYTEATAKVENTRRKKKGLEEVYAGDYVDDTEAQMNVRLQAILQDGAEDYLARHPEASYDDVKAHLNGIESQDRVFDLNAPVVDSISATVTP